MDRGFWITWYDLPEQGRDAYLSWLHEKYIPDCMKRPGFLWAAHYASIKIEATTHARRSALAHTSNLGVPAGDRYILMFGAEDAHVFGNPVPSAYNAGLPAADRKMLALRIGERVNVMIEAARVEGPEAKAYKEGMLPAPFIQFGSFISDWKDEEEMLAWYAQWRMPAMSRLPGIIRTRKLSSVAGWAKHSLMYEWVSREARDKNFNSHEDAYPDMKAWSDRMVPKLIHAPGSANLAHRIWPPVKA